MLKNIYFKFGAGPEHPRLRCSPGVVTVFVGPNNAGKSRVLVEIAEAVGARLPDRDDHRRRSLSSGIGTASSERLILRSLKLGLPQDKSLRATFIKAVAKDLADLTLTSKGGREVLNQWGSLMGALGMGLQFKDLVEKGKLNLPKADRKKKAPPPEDEQELNTFFEELKQHVQPRRLRKIARRLIAKRIVNVTGYVGLLAPHTIVLDGTTRLTLVKDRGAADWRGQDGNLLANLLKDRHRLETLRRIVHNALDHFPVIDTTHPGATQLKMSKEHPLERERSTQPDALQYFDKAQPIGAFSDGVKSFVGLLSAVLSGDHKVILIDEPEAFLHPPLARTLGAELHKLAREHHAQVFAATHNPDFLMGCIQAGTEVSIVRLTYKDTQATARELKPERLRHIMRQPLMRSTGVLGALFHSGAVVCESDSDRAFYQEINERLLASGRGAQGVAFLNAQNKQTIERLISPLREMGIPAAAVLDLDVLSPGEDLSRLLMATGTERAIRESLLQTRDRFFRRCKELSEGDADAAKAQMKLKGIHLLPERERAEFQSILLRPLAERGIFVVPEGELESWLPSLTQGVGRSDKPKWLMKVFERLGDEPDQPGYVQPGPQDVWTFLDGIADWIANPLLGMPDPPERARAVPGKA
ncbi:AAA family ATPase [Archangium gephyra]|uniref:AAA family ATPase n=1 Tax=Archangium gephyra TaxID=48 RepID=UPI0035D51781